MKLLVAYALSGLHVVSVLLAFSGTCTQGNDSAFAASLLFAPPLAIASGVLWWVSRGSRMPFAGAAAMLAGVCVVLPALFSATLGGHHLCGAEYDGYGIGATHALWAPLHLTFFLGVAAVCLRAAAGSKPTPKPE